MLWYKAWLETRMRFLLSLAGITWLCGYTDVYRSLRFVDATTHARYFYNLVHFADDTLCVLWVAAVTLLTMGGLLREKSAGTSWFTLTLPVSRGHLMAVRICVVFAEALLLAIIPMAAVVLLIGTHGKPLLVEQVWYHVILLAGGGTLFVSLPLLVSSTIEGEYTAPVVGVGCVLLMAFGFSQSLSSYDPVVFIMGNEFFDRSAALLRGPIPWAHVAATAMIAAMLIGISVKAIQKREF